MRFLNVIRFAVLGSALTAMGAYEVEITFKNGATRSLDELVMQSGKVVLTKENLSVPIAQVQSAIFRFDTSLTQEECDGLIARGDFEGLEQRLDELLGSVPQAALALPGNLDVYLQYRLRADFWLGQYEECEQTAELLKRKGSEYAGLADLYLVLSLFEQEHPREEIEKAFSEIESPDNISAPIAEVIRGRLAMDAREYEAALQHFATVLAYHRRASEWVPAATFYEARIYRRTGYLESADHILEEFKIAYPEGYWSDRVDELK